MIVAKVDKETGEASPLGKGTLAGAEYTVRYYAGQYDENNLPAVATRTWVFKTDSDGFAGFGKDYLVSGDPLYTNSKGLPTLPLGTVSIQETKAPTGYLLSDTKASVQHITFAGTLETVHTFVEPDENNPTTREPVRRGDVTLVKADGETQVRLAGVPFRITSSTGESHIVVNIRKGRMVNPSPPLVVVPI